MKNLLFFLISSCCFSCTIKTNILILKPAEISLPKNIKTMGIIDRSEAEDIKLNHKERFLTKETRDQDSIGKTTELNALLNLLSTSPRFTFKKIPLELKESKDGYTIADRLDSIRVKKICLENNVDALISLELYDSDNLNLAGLIMDVKNGFRLYDPTQTKPLDEFISTSRNPMNNGYKYKTFNNYIEHSSTKSAILYAQRIAPVYIYEERIIMKNSGIYFRQNKAARKAIEQNNWAAAIDVWKFNERHPTTNKLTGRAFYNIAVGYEFLDNLELALEYADKAYNLYHYKPAKFYINLIKQRMEEKEILNTQLSLN